MLIAALSFPLCATGQETEQGKEKTGLEKGFYCNVEISADFSYNRYSLEKRIVGKGENAKEIASKSFFGYDVTMAFGYRFIPQFTLAAGFGGGTVTKFWDTSLPVFLRLRSDILDRKVSPYVQLDLGWSFFLASKTQNITYSEKPEMYLNSCRGKYIYDYVNSKRDNGYLSLSGSERYKWDERTRKEAEGTLRGDVSYILPGRGHSYGKSGFFSVLTVGVSWKVGERSRMNAGVSSGFVQYDYGQYGKNAAGSTDGDLIWCGDIKYVSIPTESYKFQKDDLVKWTENGYDRFGAEKSEEKSEPRLDSVIYGTEEAVFCPGRIPFFRRFRPCAQIRIGFTF